MFSSPVMNLRKEPQSTMANQTFFDRQYRLKAGVAGEVGFTIGEPTPPHNSALHVSFSIEKTDSETLNTTKISVWNLNDAHINTLMEDNCMIEICAGYGNARPCIFRGTITNVQTALDGTDRSTDIEAIDGFGELRDTHVVLSYKGEVDVGTLIEACADKIGMPVLYSKTAEATVRSRKLASGYSCGGAVKSALTKICAIAGVKWTIQNGTLQIQNAGEPISNAVQVLSPETGLIGIPKRIYNSAVASGEDTGSTLKDSLFGYEVVYFLNGNIGVNDLVKLETKLVTGIFRVYKLQIDGDNLSGDWQCTAQLVEVAK